jgi:hypothetical protein
VGKNRFVTPQLVTLDLTDGDWLRVKRELNTGEKRALQGAGFRDVKGVVGSDDIKNDAILQVNWGEAEIARVCMWVKEWSFRDAQNAPVPVTRETVSALHSDSFDEIVKALDKHVEAIEAERKNAIGATGSAPTSS